MSRFLHYFIITYYVGIKKIKQNLVSVVKRITVRNAKQRLYAVRKLKIKK